MSEPKQRGCLAMAFWLWLASALMYSGCQNARIKYDNKEIEKTTIHSLVTKPPEKARWVEVRGTTVSGSEFVEGQQKYAVLLAPESKMALYVLLAKESELGRKSGSLTSVQGMVRPREGDKPFPRPNVSTDTKIGNLILSENDTPPTFWSSEFLMILGFILLGGADPRKY